MSELFLEEGGGGVIGHRQKDDFRHTAYVHSTFIIISLRTELTALYIFLIFVYLTFTVKPVLGGRSKEDQI